MSITSMMFLFVLGIQGELDLTLNLGAGVAPTELPTAGPQATLTVGYDVLDALGVEIQSGCLWLPDRHVAVGDPLWKESTTTGQQMRCKFGGNLRLRSAFAETGFESAFGFAYQLAYDFDRQWRSAEDILLDSQDPTLEHSAAVTARLGGYHRLGNVGSLVFGADATIPVIGTFAHVYAGAYIGIRTSFFP